MATPFMDLDLPTVSVTPGPEWASQLNTALTTIDAHDHSSGNGVRITPTGLNINVDLEFNSQNATEIRSVRMDNNGSALAGVNDLRCIYVSGNNLFYNNGVGTPVQITSGAGLNAASIGGIGGDYATSSASVSYANSNKTFTFWQSSNTSAHIDVGNVVIREAAASANGITLKSPTSLSSGYNWIFPTGLPGTGTTKILTIDSSGQVGAQYDTDGSSLEVSSNTIRIKALGVGTSHLGTGALSADATGLTKMADGYLAASSSGRAKMADGFLSADSTGRAKMADGFVTRSKQEAVGQQISASCNTVDITSPTYVDVTNLSCTITTSGRPVFIMMFGDNSGSFASVHTNSGNGSIAIVRDSTQLTHYFFGTSVGGVSGDISHIDVPPAGTYTYKIQARLSGAGTFQVDNFKLAVWEL